MAVSVAVCEIKSKSGVTLKTGLGFVQGHWKWHHFDRSHTSSYSPSIVTMAIFCIVCEIWRLIGRKSRIFYTPPVFSASAVGISWTCFMLIKLEWLGYRMVKKLWQYVKPFSSDTGTWPTDRRTDIIAISISRVSVLTCVSVLTRDKNCKHVSVKDAEAGVFVILTTDITT